MLEAVGVPIRSDGDHTGRELGILRGLEKRTEIRPSARDQHDQ